jgi:hypothetical protein
MTAPTPNPVLTDPDLTKPILDLIREVVPDADVWVDAWNGPLGGRTPRSFFGRPEEAILRDLVLATKYGYPA